MLLAVDETSVLRMIVDGQDRGIPAGFLLSSSCTTEDVTKFFEVVKQQIPEFNPQFLMSDMADAFWKGFKKVFPNSQTKRLWCHWHILRAMLSKAEEVLGKVTDATKTPEAGLPQASSEPVSAYGQLIFAGRNSQ
uniref:MULE domain-containing protein n=1 Tax=Caenorhabditis japonica TaxID=281687 RepID=A0A8R1I5L0_CAEJA